MRKNREYENNYDGPTQSRESNLRNARLDSGESNNDRRYSDRNRERSDNRTNAGDEGYDNYDAEFNSPFNNRMTDNDWQPGGHEANRYRSRGDSNRWHPANDWQNARNSDREWADDNRRYRGGNWNEYRSQGGPWYDRDRMNERRDWNDHQRQAGSWNDRGSWDARSNWNRSQGNQWNDNSRWYPEDEWRNMQDQDTWNSSFQSKGRGEGYSTNEYYNRTRQQDRHGSASYYSNEQQNRGIHKGKGPKGYKRSDERILDDINDRLTDDDYVDASNIEVSVSDSEVVLTGTVSSREDKRRAEDIADSASGVRNVENRLRISQDQASKMSVQDTGSVDRQSANGQTNATGETKNKK